MKVIQANSKFLANGIVWTLEDVIPGLDVKISGINRPPPILIAKAGGKTLYIGLSRIEKWVEGGIING